MWNPLHSGCLHTPQTPKPGELHTHGTKMASKLLSIVVDMVYCFCFLVFLEIQSISGRFNNFLVSLAHIRGNKLVLACLL